jgi:hypothetical protein
MLLRSILALAALCAAIGTAHALDSREAENAKAACAQTHDTCLQACNAAYPGTNVLAQGLRTNCQNQCNSAAFECNNSVDLKSTAIPSDKATNTRKLVP